MPDETFYFKDSVIPEKLDKIPDSIFLPIRTGLLNETQVEIEYSSSEKTQKRNILPEVLFCYSDEWYIAAYCFLRDEQRTFRFDRVISAAVTDIKETSYGVAEDIRENGLPWDRFAPFEVTEPEVKEHTSGLWAKMELVAKKNKFEAHLSNSYGGISTPKTTRDISFDLVNDAEKGRLERVKKDLAAGADINFVAGDGYTPFSAAAAYGHIEIMKYLVAHGADPYAVAPNGTDALMNAVQSSGNMDAIRYLVEDLKFQIENSDNRLWSPLFWAVLKNNLDVIEYLLSHGADVSRTDRDKNSLLMVAIEHCNCEEKTIKMIQILIHYGVDVFARDKKGRTALYHALERNYLECIRLFFSLGLPAADFDKNSVSPLLFILRCFDKNSWRFRDTGAHSKRLQLLEDMVRLLVEHGADVAASDCSGVVPLMLAHDANLNFLLKNGAWAGAFDRTGKTVAMYHASCIDELKLLKEYDADLEACDFEGNDILRYVPAKHFTIKELTTEFALPVTRKNNCGDTLLHCAARAHTPNLPLIKFLIRNGADPFAKNNDGDVPIDHFPLQYVYKKYPKGFVYLLDTVENDDDCDCDWC